MDNRRMLFAAGGMALISAGVPGHARGAAPTFTSWLTRSYDTNRSSANLSESILTQSNVKPSNFGLNWFQAVDDQVYAQPLYAFQVAGTKQGTVNLLFIATSNNTVFAFNADTGSLVWSKNFNNGNPAPDNTQVNGGHTCGNNGNNNGNGGSGHLGIVGTPVIDPNTSPPTLFVVTHTMENCSGSACNSSNMTYRLQSINAATGVPIAATSPIGQGVQPFDPSAENQRPGLALANGLVYVSFGSYCDGPQGNGTGYHGFVFAFLESLTDSPGYFQATIPANQAGGIWQSAQAPAVEPVPVGGSQDIFVATGNGDTTGIVSATDQLGGGNSQGPNYSDSVVGISTNMGTTSSHTWTPDDFQTLEDQDLDVSVSGPSLLPIAGTSFVQILQGSKTGKIYNLVFDSSKTSYQLNSIQNPIVVENSGNKIHNIVVSANGTSHSPALYANGGAAVYGFQINPSNGLISGTDFARNTQVQGGGAMTLSANANASGTGVLWVVNPTGNDQTSHRTLNALNADTMATLWTSDQNGATDDLGSGVYWTPPTVVNGRVYVATSSARRGSPPHVLNGPQHPFEILAYGIQYPYTFIAQPQAQSNGIAVCVHCPAFASLPENWVGTNGSLFVRSNTGGVWGIPSAVTAANLAPSGAGVAVAPQTATQSDAFLVGSDGTVDMVANTTSGWQAPMALTSSNFAPPGAPLIALNNAGQVGTLMIDNNGALRIIWWNPLLGWLGPVALTPYNYAPPGGMIAVGTRSSGEIDVFAIGSDGALKYMAFNGSVWSGPIPLTVTGFATPGAPVATGLDVHGFLNVMTIANDGALYTKWDCTALWCGPTALTGTGFAPPGGYLSLATFNNQSLNVFLVDATGTVQTLLNPGLGWQGPTAIAGNLAPAGGLLDAVVESSNQIDLFVVSSSATSGVIETVNAGSGWTAPIPLP